MNWTRGKAIGQGSSATVYAAKNQQSGETIAVKSTEFHRSRFLQREAKILSSLNSPYIIKYRGSEITKEPFNETYNLLMEYAPYGTLTDVAAKNGGFIDESQVVKYTRQILLGLEYIHNLKGIAHCDIKGSNVLVGINGDIKIADFGCAKLIKPEITEPVKGTPAFMAARGEKKGKESEIKGSNVLVGINGDIKIADFAIKPEITEPVKGTPAFIAARGERQGKESDIKGSNVLIGINGDIKIADFGCAKLIKPEITEPVKGTPAFMAARGEKEGKESDIKGNNVLVGINGDIKIADFAIKPEITEPVKGTPAFMAARGEKQGKESDIKGSNVLVGINGDIKITDFAIKPEITEPVKGTPAFMAPEVARGERQGKESDIWAVGCTVIEMITGFSPWIGADLTDPVSILYRVGYLGESPELPSSISEQAKDFLRKCLRKEVKERWTATQLLNHPFLLTKPDTEPAGLITNSPTSVTDQMFWRSVEDEEEDDLDRSSWSECHEDKRIEFLSWIGQVMVEPTWDVDCEDWIMVR